jgi:hypothetical protein
MKTKDVKLEKGDIFFKKGDFKIVKIQELIEEKEGNKALYVVLPKNKIATMAFPINEKVIRNLGFEKNKFLSQLQHQFNVYYNRQNVIFGKFKIKEGYYNICYCFDDNKCIIEKQYSKEILPRRYNRIFDGKLKYYDELKVLLQQLEIKK